ncbi:MAG: hypothetical protein ACREP9_16465, partial [Candidatus Dormibacteraceae bacterium]
MFQTVASAQLGDALTRIPDGETGERRLFVLWQGEQAFAQNPAFRQTGGRLKPQQFRAYELRPGVDVERLEFSSLGYAQAALSSYAAFRRLQEEGVIQPGIRFQVNLPSPFNPLSIFLTKRDVGRVEAAYEAAMLAEVDQIVEAIPPQDMAIQWDIPYEVRAWSGNVPVFMLQPWFDNPQEHILNLLTRLGDHIPPPVELGYHLCYGDYANHDNLLFMLLGTPKSELIRRLDSKVLNWVGRKFTGPLKDASPMVEIASALASSVSRPINFLHLPVPPGAYHAYIAPLAELERQNHTALYLGLVSLSDGYEGAMHRITAARQVINGDFGVATECGWGRCRRDDLDTLLRLHRALAQPERGIPERWGWPQFRQDRLFTT